MAPYTQSKRPDLDARYIIDLKIAQDRGLKFGQTGSFAIILYNTMPTGALVKVVKFNRNNSETEILFDKRPPQVTEVTRTRDPIQPFFESARETRCTPMWRQHEQTRCVITVDKLKALISTSEFKENQNNPRTTRTRKIPHWESCWWNKFLRSPNKNQRMAELFTKEYQEMSEDFHTVEIKTAISKLMKCSWSQTLYNARRPAIVKHLNTHITHENKPIHEQVTKSRNKFFLHVMNCFKTLTTNALVFATGRPRGITIGRSERSQMYHKAREGKAHILDRYLEDDGEYILSQKISSKKK